MENKVIQPFLRWAGGKKWFVPYMQELTEELSYRNYYEPFLGGASVFLSLDTPKHAYLSDLNEELITTYIEVRDHPENVIDALSNLDNTKDAYYIIRKNKPQNETEIAARFIYLNHTSYNGLYRVNQKGEYNVPYGYRGDFSYVNDRIRFSSKKLEKVKLSCEDFEARKYRIREGDLVFLDPPYTVSHNNNGFIKYNQKLFSLEDQYRLKKYIDYIVQKGAFYVLTNAANETIKELFDGDKGSVSLTRNSLIGGKKAQREKVTELVFTNIPCAYEIINDYKNKNN